MSQKLKITFTGGEQIGEEVERELSSTLLVGRSHSADIRVKEPDVSGKHLEIVRRDDGCFARNLSRFPAKVDGKPLNTGEEAPLRKKSLVEIGSHLRMRIDGLPQGPTRSDDGGTSSVPGRGTESLTNATVFAGEDTFATVAGDVPADLNEVAHGSVEESATRDILSMFGDQSFSEVLRTEAKKTPPPPVATEAENQIAKDEAVTADDLPDAPGESFLAGLPKAAPAAVAAEPAAEQTSPAVTGISAADLNGQTETGVDESETGGGETQEMVTRAGSMQEMLELRRKLERKTAARHWRFGACIALSLALLAGVWLLTADRRHLDDAEGPFRPDGQPDVADIDILGADGAPEMFLEHPQDPRAKVVRSADTNEIEVVSFLGQDRDVPFRMVFTRKRDAAELTLSLAESFNRWANKMGEKGFSFELTRNGKPIEPEFFDGVFPGYCQYQTQCGVSFIRADYTRSTSHVMWRGVSYRFRNGDMTYSLCNEIPEKYWKRGESRLRYSPFCGLYGKFLGDQWDSPGKEMLLQGVTEDELLARVRRELSVERPADWETVEKRIDTLLALTWGKNTANARTAWECRDVLLSLKSRYYNERLLAYETAFANGDEKTMRSIFSDCLHVFGASKRDRRYYLVNDPEVWKCQRDR